MYVEISGKPPKTQIWNKSELEIEKQVSWRYVVGSESRRTRWPLLGREEAPGWSWYFSFSQVTCLRSSSLPHGHGSPDFTLHVFDSYFPDLPRKSETQSKMHISDASGKPVPLTPSILSSFIPPFWAPLLSHRKAQMCRPGFSSALSCAFPKASQQRNPLLLLTNVFIFLLPIPHLPFSNYPQQAWPSTFTIQNSHNKKKKKKSQNWGKRIQKQVSKQQKPSKGKFQLRGAHSSGH